MEDNIYTPGQETTDSSPLPIPQITLESLGFLNTTAKWTKFMAIIGFIGIAFMLSAGVFLVIYFTAIKHIQTHASYPFPLPWVGAIYFIFAAVYVMPVIYLNNFSNFMSKAIAFRETELLTNALENIKKHFKYLGIATIVMIATNFIAIVGFSIFAVSRVSHHI